jgi:hypothetical protein
MGGNHTERNRSIESDSMDRTFRKKSDEICGAVREALAADSPDCLKPVLKRSKAALFVSKASAALFNNAADLIFV